ncbi:hypothetical protein CEXT_644871 [Caerostris extrusa]|uniref:Uncharacterized protein n=1 Tax=Caerostris extrusa TaxID=172846 RepID=A0AAV4WW46_CAEEX|nr:hypothetical protein CEXT_644871 [Caerostris extrusa]
MQSNRHNPELRQPLLFTLTPLLINQFGGKVVFLWHVTRHFLCTIPDLMLSNSTWEFDRLNLKMLPTHSKKGEETFPLEMDHLPEFAIKKCQVELKETPEKKLKALQEVREFFEKEPENE